MTKSEIIKKIHSENNLNYVDVAKIVNQTFEEISKYTNELFALVNNAGIVLAGPVEYIPIELLKQQFDVNVFGAIRVAQKFLPLLSKKDSRIVNISSMASYGIFPFVSPYCVSKRSLDMFFNSLLLETKENNLKIISIKPGVVRTPIWDKSLEVCEKNMEFLCEEGKKKYEKEFAFLTQNAKKNNEKGLLPKDVANAVLKALNSKHPKLSYNVGKDSYFARFISFLPQKFSNSLVRFGLKKRMSRQ